jgi:integrase
MKFNINKKVRKDKNGKIVRTELWYSCTYEGKRIRKPLGLTDTKANRKFVENHIFPDLLVQFKTGEFFENTNTMPIVNEFIKVSLELHKNRRNSITQNDYISIHKNHIKEFLGLKKLDEIKPSHLEMWQNYLIDKGLSHARIRTIRTVLYTMYDDALKDEIVTKNPLDLVSTPIIQDVDIKPFTLEEMQLIISKAKGQLKNFYATAFFTGMRSGELIGLRWEDIDFENFEISINRRIKNGEIALPKTKSSKRVIDIIDTLMPYLEAQYKLTGEFNSFVFLNQNSEHCYDIKRIRERYWKKHLKSIGIEYRPIYHTRHSFTTLMLSNNEDILWVSNMLSHKDSNVTFSKYSRYIKNDKKQRANFLKKDMF